MDWKQRYNQANEAYFKERYPHAYKDGHYHKPTIPKVNTSNGLTNAICQYLMWVGGIGNRINVSGRLVEKTEKTTTGQTITAGKKFIKSSTLKGTADITALLPNGRTAYIEIKVGKDKPRPAQLEMQQRVRAANGCYEFITCMDEFFTLYDNQMSQTLF